MHYTLGLLLGFIALDHSELAALIHKTKLVGGRRQRVFALSEALAVLNGYADARKSMGIYVW